MQPKMPVKTAEVNILYVNAPDKKPEWGSIKVEPAVEGREYLDVWHENITEFDTGPAIVSYTTKEARQGPPFVTARRMSPLNKKPEIGNGGLRAAPGKPAAIGGDKDCIIWLENQVSAMIEAHGKRPNAEEYKDMIDMALRGYKYQEAARKKELNPQRADDMDDEIPDFANDLTEDYK